MNFDVLSDKELVLISLKYKLIEKKDIPLTTRNKLLRLIKDFLQRKLQTYGQRQRRHSVSSNIQKQTINNTKSIETVPQPRAQKQRRMSHPITNIEKVDAKETLQINKTRHDAQEEVIKAAPVKPVE